MQAWREKQKKGQKTTRKNLENTHTMKEKREKN